MNKSNRRILQFAKFLIRTQGRALLQHAFTMANVSGDLNHFRGMRDAITSTGKYICYQDTESEIWIKANPDYDWKKRHPIWAIWYEVSIRMLIPYAFGILTAFLAMKFPIVRTTVDQLLNQL